MQRRQFVQMAGLGAAAVTSTGNLSCGRPAEEQKPARRALMKVGTQQYPGLRPPDGYSDEHLGVLAALGVNHLVRSLPREVDENWTAEGMMRIKERVEKFGIHIDQILCPFTSTFRNILTGKSPERDREIDTFCELIRSVAKAGIPSLQYFFTPDGRVERSGRKPVRGGASGGAFVYEEAKEEPPLTTAGPLSEEQFWERITYTLKRIVPVAEEHKIKLACHPHDPAMPPGKAFRGAWRVLASPKELQRFLDISPSKYHGLHLCQGTVAEMLNEPGKEIYEVIRQFGSQGKIFSVHFRNIRGKRANFVETLIDDGDVDMLKAARVYKDVGFDGMLMPDHVPQITGDPKGFLAFCFTFGYIKALIAAVDAEG